MGGRIALVGLAVVAALAGCSASPAVVKDQPVPFATASAIALSLSACKAVTGATNTNRPKAEKSIGSTDPKLFTAWADVVGAAAATVEDPILKSQLFNLSDTIQGWITRPPSRVQLRGLSDDVGRACGKFLNPSSPPVSP